MTAQLDFLERFVRGGHKAQETIDDLIAMHKARRTDPEPSHAAARALVKSGALTRQQREVSALVHARPGLTSHELSDGNAALRYIIARRLPELARPPLNRVRRGPERKCTVTGRLATTWHPL